MDANKQIVRRHFDEYAQSWHQRMQHHVYAMRYRAVERMVAGRSPRSVIDVGCGTGDYCRLFTPGRVGYLGIDISEKMIAECARLYPGHEFRVADGDGIDALAGSFDLVLSVGVLEYLPQPLAHLKELARVTEPGGSIIVTTPNGSNRSRRLDRAARALVEAGPVRALRRALGRTGRSAERNPGGYVKDERIRHRAMTVDELRDAGPALGLHAAEWAYVSLYLLPELIPGAARINAWISRALSGRPGLTWLTRPTALVLVVRLEKSQAQTVSQQARPRARSEPPM